MPRGLVAGESRVARGFLGEAERRGLAEVIRQLGTRPLAGLGALAFECLTHLPVQQHPGGARDRRVHDVAHQCVRECETLELRGVFDEEPHGQALLERIERRLLREAARPTDDLERDATAERGGDLEHIAAGRRQQREAALDESPYAFGRHVGERASELGRIVQLRGVLVDLPQQLTHEERAAFGDLVESSRQTEHDRHGFGRGHRAHQRPDLVVVESLEVNPLDLTASHETIEQLGPFAGDLVVSIGDDHPEVRQLRVSNEMAQQRARRTVGPVRICDHEDERPTLDAGDRGRDRLEESEAIELGVDTGVRQIVLVALAHDCGHENGELGREIRERRVVDAQEGRLEDLRDRLVVAYRLRPRNAR